MGKRINALCLFVLIGFKFKKACVLNPFATEPENNLMDEKENRRFYNFVDNCFNYTKDFNVLLLPIVFPAHFALIIHERKGKTILYDPKPERNRIASTYPKCSERPLLIKEALEVLDETFCPNQFNIEIAILHHLLFSQMEME